MELSGVKVSHRIRKILNRYIAARRECIKANNRYKNNKWKSKHSPYLSDRGRDDLIIQSSKRLLLARQDRAFLKIKIESLGIVLTEEWFKAYPVTSVNQADNK